MSTTDTKSHKGKDIKTEQSQRVQQILASSKTKEKRPKNLEQKIRLVKTSVAEAYADEDIERFLKESNYDEQTVINNILDGIAPRPGDSWSVVHNKMTKEERDAKKATAQQQQSTKPRGRGGRGGMEGQRSREGDDKKGARDNSRGRGKAQNQRGRGGGRGAGTSSKITKENGSSADQPSTQPPSATTTAPPPSRTIIPSGIITSTPNHPAPTVAQIVAGTVTLPTTASTPTTTVAVTTSSTGSASSSAAVSSGTPSTASEGATSQASQHESTGTALPPSNETYSIVEQTNASQATPVQQKEPSEPKHEATAAAIANTPQKATTQQPKTTQPATQQNYPRTGYQKKAQWKPKSAKESVRTPATTQVPTIQSTVHTHSYQPARGPVVLPGDFPSDIDDKALNFTFGNFHIEDDKAQSEETAQPQTQSLQAQQQIAQPQPPIQSQPQPQQTQTTQQSSQPQPTQPTSSQPQTQLSSQSQQAQSQIQPQSQLHQHSQSHSHQHQHTHQQPEAKHQNKPHQPHHTTIQQAVPISTTGVLEPDHHLRADQQPLHTMHHMSAEDLSQLYYMSPGHVMPFPLSHFPHPYEAETSGYYDAGYQQSTYRADGTKYPPMGRSTSPISSSTYRDPKFTGQDGSSSSAQGTQTQPTGPGSPQTSQPHTFAPLQPPFSTMYPYYMGQFPQFSPANSPQYPFRLPVFKSPPYANYGGGMSSPAYPPTGTGYPEELAGQKYEAYMPPYTYLQPEAFMKQQQQPQQPPQQPQSQPTTQSGSANAPSGAKSQQFASGANGDLSSAGKNAQQEYAKYSTSSAPGRDSSLYGPGVGAPQYPIAYRPYP